MADARSPERHRAAMLAGELRILVGGLSRRLRDQTASNDLTSSQKSVLLRLERDGPATMSALARAERMRPQSMGAIVAALQRVGFVDGAADPADARQTTLSLTPAFRDWVKAGRAARKDWLFQAIEHTLSLDEQAEALRAVGLLGRLIAA